MKYVIKRDGTFFVKEEVDKTVPCFTWSETEAKAKKFGSKEEADEVRKHLYGAAAVIPLKEKKQEIKERKKGVKKDGRKRAATKKTKGK